MLFRSPFLPSRLLSFTLSGLLPSLPSNPALHVPAWAVLGGNKRSSLALMSLPSCPCWWTLVLCADEHVDAVIRTHTHHTHTCLMTALKGLPTLMESPGTPLLLPPPSPTPSSPLLASIGQTGRSELLPRRQVTGSSPHMKGPFSSFNPTGPPTPPFPQHAVGWNERVLSERVMSAG